MFWYSREAIKFLKFAEHVGSDSKMTDTFCFLHDKSWNIRAGLALHAQISLSCKLKAFLWFCSRGQIIPLPLESVHPMPQLHSNKLKVHMLARLKYFSSTRRIWRTVYYDFLTLLYMASYFCFGCLKLGRNDPLDNVIEFMELEQNFSTIKTKQGTKISFIYLYINNSL